MARFVPIVRTFAPFVAGIGRMPYRRFVAYNMAGAVAWVGLCLCAGYFFGNLPFVKENFGVVVLAIIAVSLLPAIAEWLRYRRSLVAADALN
jgi:membrane-associated protein